jgi:hypothetical protein
MTSGGFDPTRLPRILISAQAFQRLQLYVDLCPFEVSGLGTVTPFGEDLLVTEIFLMRQRASSTDTELDSQAVAEHLLHALQQGRDLTALRVWWHSHGEGEVYWSNTDEQTIESLHIDQLVSIVGNKRHQFSCRLDLFSPDRVTRNSLPLLPFPDGTPSDEEVLRRQVLAELREKVTLIQRDIPLVSELLLDPSSTLEIPVTFEELEPPPHH